MQRCIIESNLKSVRLDDYSLSSGNHCAHHLPQRKVGKERKERETGGRGTEGIWIRICAKLTLGLFRDRWESRTA